MRSVGSAGLPVGSAVSGIVQDVADQFARRGLHLGQVLRAAEALGVDLVDVLGARRAGGEPAVLGGDLQPADRRAVARRLGQLGGDRARRPARSRVTWSGDSAFSDRLLLRGRRGIDARVDRRAEAFASSAS